MGALLMLNKACLSHFKFPQAEKHYKLATSEAGYGLGLKNYGCPHR
jgi:hypothetical protein